MIGPEHVRWFGRSWGAAICEPAYECPRPTGSCVACERPFVEGDQGIVTGMWGAPDADLSAAWHLACVLQHIGVARGTVHILHFGLPLCEFTRDVPARWPLGMTWVSLDDATQATCEACMAVLRVRFPKYAVAPRNDG